MTPRDVSADLSPTKNDDQTDQQKSSFIHGVSKIWLLFWNGSHANSPLYRDPTVGPKSLTLFLPTLFGKRGILTHSPLPWVFCPISFALPSC